MNYCPAIIDCYDERRITTINITGRVVIMEMVTTTKAATTTMQGLRIVIVIATTVGTITKPGLIASDESDIIFLFCMLLLVSFMNSWVAAGLPRLLIHRYHCLYRHHQRYHPVLD